MIIPIVLHTNPDKWLLVRRRCSVVQPMSSASLPHYIPPGFSFISFELMATEKFIVYIFYFNSLFLISNRCSIGAR